MFLEALEKQNPNLINATLALFKQGQLQPDTVVIDVDQLLINAKSMKQVADESGIRLYAMTKQFGRNPMIAKLLIEECGYEGIVCVDFKEARLMAAHGLPIANVGHLVQPPSNMIHSLVANIKPQVMTVYSLEKAQQISDAAVTAGRQQGLLLKFFHRRDKLYVNQESGFALSRLEEVVRSIQDMPGVYIEGVTHFPCFLFDSGSKKTQPTPNLMTLLEAKQGLNALGIPCSQVNAPSSTNSETIPMLAKYGCTHGEPGHALTGTTPANAIEPQVERIAMLYLSEISHHHTDNSYCFGGGYYRRGLLENARVYSAHGSERTAIFNDETDSIDYHLRIPGHYPIGAPVIMAYRTQVFVTRSDVALVRGVSTEQPFILGLYDSLGNEVTYA
ncbi:YhfX family PLP-dependent enzyme [Vibrio sp. YMD68]|uniref:YhfX family PLP-dependent enzyme n=1 Tax=Vibrio sp. YMD68 TaxID=3042300 RepID=UPI00249B8C6A|nr:YhfX family PLP-dependent enzyme [Vibrio sp. YMD68]WGV98558.1 YhfX family PLP-dependent enzyme [Vibrio sp. YMD68]